MMERGIIFDARQVESVQAGIMTQFWRVIRPQPPTTILNPIMVSRDSLSPSGFSFFSDEIDDILLKCPYGKLGDELWVRETHLLLPDNRRYHSDEIMYRDDPDYHICYPKKNELIPLGWKVVPSIHMKREGSRIQLKVKDRRVERLQDISRADAKTGGFLSSKYNGLEMYNGKSYGNAQLAFRAYWNDISKMVYNWDSNPWCWCITFEVINA